MRGIEESQTSLFSYVPAESQIPKEHPLRSIREIVDPILKEMSGLFDEIYSMEGRPSIPPEYLLRALLLQIFYSLRSEFQLIEHIRFNLLFRWFVGLSVDSEVWDETVFSKNRDRLLEGKVAEVFFDKVIKFAGKKGLLSSEHFSVDGTVVQAWASQKSFKLKETKGESDKNQGSGTGNADVNFRGEKRSNKTHESTTDPDSRLFRKGFNVPASLCMMGHVLMENRNGLAVSSMVTHAGTEKEREATLEMVNKRFKTKRRKTLGADKGYDVQSFADKLREQGITPHLALKKSCGAKIDRRTTRHIGYGLSQNFRKRVEEIFGWLKTVGLMRQTHFRGLARVGWMFTLSVSMYNVLRIKNLLCESG